MATATATPRRVTIIEPTITFGSKEELLNPQKKKVAAYARVSTDEDEQLSSYAAQCTYYESFIKNNPEWEFVGVYADEGITGTNTKNRENFKRMIADAKAGKIDIILTKSISRFARNTVDTLTNVRELKGIGVEVRFEKENLSSFDDKGESILTIFSSIAQQESYSISSNVTWGKRKAMMDGKVYFTYKTFLGYRKGKDGQPEIDPDGAEIIKKIYRWFLEGITINGICDLLQKQGIKSPGGKDIWSVGTVRSILSNEKYKGDALLQKSITVDFLLKKRKKNEGEIQQVYVKNNHPAIIDPDVFDLVQDELARRSKLMNRHNNGSPMNAKIICGECGGFYGHKVHHNDKYKYDVWCCNVKSKGREACGAPNIKQSVIERAFIDALQVAISEQKKMPDDTEANRIKRERLEQELIKAEEDVASAIADVKSFMSDNTRRTQDQDAYLKEHERLLAISDKKKAELKAVKKAIVSETARKVRKQIFIDAIKDLPEFICLYSDEVFQKTVDHIIARKVTEKDFVLEFYFTNGVRVDINGSKR